MRRERDHLRARVATLEQERDEARNELLLLNAVIADLQDALHTEREARDRPVSPPHQRLPTPPPLHVRPCGCTRRTSPEQSRTGGDTSTTVDGPVTVRTYHDEDHWAIRIEFQPDTGLARDGPQQSESLIDVSGQQDPVAYPLPDLTHGDEQLEHRTHECQLANIGGERMMAAADVPLAQEDVHQ